MIGFKSEVFLGASVEIGAGMKYEYFHGPIIERSDKDFDTMVENDATLDANGTVRIVGGKDNNAYAEGDSKSLTLVYSTGTKRRPKENHAKQALIALGVNLVGTGAAIAAAGFATEIANGITLGTTRALGGKPKNPDGSDAEGGYDWSDILGNAAGGAAAIGGIGLVAGTLLVGFYIKRKIEQKVQKKAAELAKKVGVAKVHSKIELNKDGVKLSVPKGKTSTQGNIRVEKNGDITLFSRGSINIRASKDINIESLMGNVNIESKKKVNVKTETSGFTVNGSDLTG